MSHWSLIAWLLWGLTFAIIEGIALFNSAPGDSLSEHLRAWLGIHRRDSAAYVYPKWFLRVTRTIFICFLIWFPIHILSGGWV